MPRTRRFTPGGYVYHVLNRANAKLKIFTTRADYEEFVQAMREALEHESSELRRVVESWLDKN